MAGISVKRQEKINFQKNKVNSSRQEEEYQFNWNIVKVREKWQVPEKIICSVNHGVMMNCAGKASVQQYIVKCLEILQ